MTVQQALKARQDATTALGETLRGLSGAERVAALREAKAVVPPGELAGLAGISRQRLYQLIGKGQRMTTATKLTDEQVVTAVRDRWSKRQARNDRPGRLHISLGVEAHEIARRLGVKQIAPRLTKLVRDGRLTRTYDDRAGDQGAYVYRPAE